MCDSDCNTTHHTIFDIGTRTEFAASLFIAKEMNNTGSLEHHQLNNALSLINLLLEIYLF
jgi:hypothetical protein